MIVLDIETEGLCPYYGQRITSIAAKDTNNNDWYEGVGGSEHALIAAFLSWLHKRCSMTHAIVTHNGKNFDVPYIIARFDMLVGQSEPAKGILLRYDHYDTREMAELVGEKWRSLDALSKKYGIKQKSGSGLWAIDLWKQCRHDELLKYNKQDVRVTEQLYIKLKEKIENG
ncbi:hypothetical protein D1BOALGB6SA_10334 [Olavius sp. associated proteobacterium Delta 1]|nr:hypothetical protein D1BOALGB6SA_10334 [Olavius sp. associated proteobacterium Delta 1]